MSKYYAVKIGRSPGVYTTWAECQAQVVGFPKASFKSFLTREAAEQFIDTGADNFIPDHIINTDGGCTGNGTLISRGGLGVTIAGPRCEIELSLPIPSHFNSIPIIPTNQLAELFAIITALKHIIDADIHGCKFVLRTDSHYSIQCLTTWYQAWQTSGWRTPRGEVKNKEVIQYALELITIVKTTNQLKFEHVYGHTGDPGNERVDSLATAALSK